MVSQLKADPTGASVGRRLGAKAQSEGKTVSASLSEAKPGNSHRREAAKKFWGADFSTPLIFYDALFAIKAFSLSCWLVGIGSAFGVLRVFVNFSPVTDL